MPGVWGTRVCVATTSRGHELCDANHFLTTRCGRDTQKTKYPPRLEIGLLHSDGLRSVAAWGDDCAASLGRVTYTASSRLERSSNAARKYGAPARWRPARGEIARAKA